MAQSIVIAGYTLRSTLKNSPRENIVTIVVTTFSKIRESKKPKRNSSKSFCQSSVVILEIIKSFLNISRLVNKKTEKMPK